MVFHMKTTLNISDVIMKRLKEEAARQGKTMSELVEAALRAFLANQRKEVKLPPLPSFESGGSFVDPSDRKSLYELMEES